MGVIVSNADTTHLCFVMFLRREKRVGRVLDTFKYTHHLHQLPSLSFGTKLFVCVVWVSITLFSACCSIHFRLRYSALLAF